MSNRQLNALFTWQQKDKEKRRARDEALKEARDKARVEEEECQAMRDKCDKRRRQDMQFEQFVDYKRKKCYTHSRHLFIPFPDTLFPLDLYVHSHHGLSKIIHTPKHVPSSLIFTADILCTCSGSSHNALHSLVIYNIAISLVLTTFP